MLRVERARSTEEERTGELNDAMREAEAKMWPPDARKITERRLGMLAQAASMVTRIDDALGNYDIRIQATESETPPPLRRHDILEPIDN